MWSRIELKSRAKTVLSSSYWKAFLVSLILAILDGGRHSSSFNFKFNGHGIRDIVRVPSIDINILFVIILIFAIFIAIGIGLVVKIFLGYPLKVGGRRYFVSSSLGDVNLNYLGYSFKEGRYLDIVKSMFYRGILLFLWFLLLIIPGIIKSYAYSMVPYILADNPHIGYKRAIELSNKMTDGEKLDIFVLDLSFIGWYLLGMLALGVGVLFVHPYLNATKAELYLVLRQKALANGLCSYKELNINEL